jgi:hypothetical protein
MMDARVQEILDNAADIQQDYVIARLTYPDSAKAARSIGLHKTTVRKWANLHELEEAVTILRRDAVEAARLALQGLAVEAVQTLGRALDGKTTAAVNAANSILDRVGLPKQTEVAGDINVSVGYPSISFNGDSGSDESLGDQ